MQLGLAAHRQQERPHGLPGRRRQTTLDPADGGLRGSRATGKRTLTDTEPVALLKDQISSLHDI